MAIIFQLNRRSMELLKMSHPAGLAVLPNFALQVGLILAVIFTDALIIDALNKQGAGCQSNDFFGFNCRQGRGYVQGSEGEVRLI